MTIIDLHCHIPKDTFIKDLDHWISQWKNTGVKYVVAVAMDLNESKKSIKLADKYDILISAAGIHPWEVKEPIKEEKIERFRELAAKADVIGEVGLDYHFIKDEERYKYQYNLFEKVLEIADEFDKPLTIHSKGAEKDVLELIKSTGISSDLVSIHWYSGPKKILEKLNDMGISFSICPAVTYSSHREVAEVVSSDQLLTESDGDVKYQGELGHPGKIPTVIEEISRIKNETSDKITNQLYNNSVSFLNLK